MGIFSKKTDKAKSWMKKPPTGQEAAVEADKKKDDKADEPALKKGALAKDFGGTSWGVLIEPVLTEKASREQALGKYQFIVAVDANKAQVAAAVSDLYGVKPASVRIIGAKGKNVRFGRFRGRQKDFKKAIVTLKPGESLSAFETA